MDHRVRFLTFSFVEPIRGRPSNNSRFSLANNRSFRRVAEHIRLGTPSALHGNERGSKMSTILIVLLVLFLLGGGGWGYSRWRN
jgi:hypothetical protein